MKKRILCFGDSNTYGVDPVTQGRYDDQVRWPGVMQKLLGEDYTVIEEGQGGRTIAFDDPWEGGTKCGMKYALPMLESHTPLDLVIVMLGTNDMKQRFHVSAFDISWSLEALIQMMQAKLRLISPDTKILVVSPIHIGEGIANSIFGEMFGVGAIQKSHQLAGKYQAVAAKYGCGFFDAGTVAKASLVDCLHMMPESHKALGEALTGVVRDLLN